MAFAKGLFASEEAHAVLIDYRPVNPANRLADVRTAFSRIGINIDDADLVEYDRFNPGNFETTLLQRLRVHGTRRAVIDISTMSKLAILLVLQACQRADVDIRIIYAEARTYGPSRAEFERARKHNEIHRPSLHVFNGIHGVVRVDSLASVAMQGQPTAAIVFMSFNDALTQLLLNTVYPGRLFLINGRPPRHSWREAATAWVHEQVRHEWAEDNPIAAERAKGQPLRSVSTLDYRESVSLLLTLYWELSATNRILLAPSGSKMQTVACYMAKALHPDIHIEYPSPEGFAPEYSAGIGTRWKLDLGSFQSTLSMIQEAERREYLEIAGQERPGVDSG